MNDKLHKTPTDKLQKVGIMIPPLHDQYSTGMLLKNLQKKAVISSVFFKRQRRVPSNKCSIYSPQ
jgi:hypothetical protein